MKKFWLKFKKWILLALSIGTITTAVIFGAPGTDEQIANKVLEKYQQAVGINSDSITDKASQIRIATENQYPDSTLKQRTENGLIFQLPNGIQEQRYTTGPLHWRQNDNDEWTEIDTGIEDFNVDKWAYHVKSARFDTLLTADGQRRFYPRRWIIDEYVDFGVLEWETKSNWQVVPTGTMSFTKNRLTGENKTTHNFEIGFTGKGVKTELIIKNSTVARPLRWKVDLVGLDWKDGVLVSQKDGKEVGFIQSPFWTDSSINQEIHYILWEYLGGYITLTPDFTNTVFPVKIDPDYSIAATGDDGHQTFTTLTTNATTAQIGWGMAQQNGWFRFTGIVANKDDNCTAASIALYCTYANNGFAADFYGIDEDDHAAPTTNAEWVTDHGIHTTATALWDDPVGGDDWNTNETGISPDISTIFDELFGRAGWLTGYDVGIHIDGNYKYFEFQTRTFATWDNTTYAEPILSLTISGGAPPAAEEELFPIIMREE